MGFDGLFLTLWSSIASFANVLIYRLPLKKSILLPASHCTICKKEIKIYHNIPIVSWLFLRGKCGFCGEKISIVYPMVELFGVIIFAVVFIKIYPLFGVLNFVCSLIIGIVFVLLLALSVIDIRYKAVPDALLFSTLALSLVYGICFDILIDQKFYTSAMGATLGICLWLIAFCIKKITHRDAMGSADAFIASIMGVVLGFKMGFLAVYLGAIFTLPFYVLARKRNYELAFVPFLTAGAFVTFCFGEWILRKIYE